MEQVLAVLGRAWAHSSRDGLMFTVTFNHGLRASETVGLTPDNVRDGYLDIQRLKGSRHTIQPLVEHANPLLNEKSALIELALKSTRLFPIGRKHFGKLFKRYAREAGIPAHLAHPHILKHSLANKLLKHVDIADVKQYLGHARISSTAEYLKRDDQEASASAGRALGALPQVD